MSENENAIDLKLLQEICPTAATVYSKNTIIMFRCTKKEAEIIATCIIKLWGLIPKPICKGCGFDGYMEEADYEDNCPDCGAQLEEATP